MGVKSAYERFLDLKGILSGRTVWGIAEKIAMGAAAFLLSRAGILGGGHPFGVAFAAAAGVGGQAVLPFLGVCAGYLSAGIGIGGLRYLSAVLLIFIFGHVFREQRFVRGLVYPAAVSAGTLGVIGIVFAVAGESSLKSFVMLLSEAVLCGGSAYFYRLFLRKDRGDDTFQREGYNRYVLAGFVFSVTCLISLASLEVVGVSLGRAAGSILVLLCASNAGFVGGAVGGVLCGLAMDLTGGRVAFTMIYAVSGMVSGIFSKQGRFVTSIIYVIVNSLCILWLIDVYPDVNMGMYEAFAASVIVMLLPVRAGRALASVFRFGEDGDMRSERIRSFLTHRLDMAAEAFERVCDAFQDDVSRLAATKATGDSERRYNQQMKRDVMTRGIMREQFNGVAELFRQTSERLIGGLRFDLKAEDRLARYVRSLGVDSRAGVFRDTQGRLHAELVGEDLSGVMARLSDVKAELSSLTGVSFGLPRVECGNFGNRIHLDEAEPLSATIGVAIKRKNGERTSGDSGSWFKNDEGQLFVLLSDGMGSGPEAARESACAVRIVESLIRAGISPVQALKLLNCSLLTRPDVSCTTVDLLILDLFSGAGIFYKYGAAPSYVHSNGRVSRVTGCGYPAGGRMDPPEETRLLLDDGDVIALVSDGVGGGGRRGVLEFINHYNGESARDLAVGILKNAAGGDDAEDDMTVMAIKIEKRSVG